MRYYARYRDKRTADNPVSPQSLVFPGDTKKSQRSFVKLASRRVMQLSAQMLRVANIVVRPVKSLFPRRTVKLIPASIS